MLCFFRSTDNGQQFLGMTIDTDSDTDTEV